MDSVRDKITVFVRDYFNDLLINTNPYTDEDIYLATLVKDVSSKTYESFPPIDNIEIFLRSALCLNIYVYDIPSIAKRFTGDTSFSIVTIDDTFCRFIHYKFRFGLSKHEKCLYIKNIGIGSEYLHGQDQMIDRLVDIYERYINKEEYMVLSNRPIVETQEEVPKLQTFLYDCFKSKKLRLR